MKKDMTPEEYLQRVLTTEVSDTCPMRRTLELLSGKWRTHIIYELCRKPTCRFGELKKAVPRITNTMLSSTCVIWRSWASFIGNSITRFRPVWSIL